MNVPTITGLPHVTVGAACCVALRPLADAILCYHVLLSHTLQCSHFAHIKKDRFSSRSQSGTHLQGRTGDKKSSSNTVTTRTRAFAKSHMTTLMISRLPALKRHFANTCSSECLLPRFTLHQWRDALLWHIDCGIHRNHSSTLLMD